MILIQGDNGQGKSNLMEAVYLLSIAKSLRASTDKELVQHQSGHKKPHSQVSATIQRGVNTLKLQIDLMNPSDQSEESQIPTARSVHKYIKVNGAPRRTSDMVGLLNAVMFTAEDLELVYGAPSIRRRYLDILISQLDQNYLKTLQRYQRIVYQRNQLLKTLKDGRSKTNELDFWDEKLISEGK